MHIQMSDNQAQAPEGHGEDTANSDQSDLEEQIGRSGQPVPVGGIPDEQSVSELLRYLSNVRTEAAQRQTASNVPQLDSALQALATQAGAQV